MSTSLLRLLPLFERELMRAEAMVLATVVHTEGPTYTKPGAHMLIAHSGEYAGLLSGGCLEGDLSERARRVLHTGVCELVRYDMRGPDDLLFGLGSGCEGAMDVFLQRLDAAQNWQPLRRLADSWRARRAELVLWVVPSSTRTGQAFANATALPAGSGIFADDAQPFAAASSAVQGLVDFAATLPRGLGSRLLPQALPGTDLFALEQPRRARVLLLGAGPDALPVAELTAFLGWSLTVVDHRSHYAQAKRFASAESVLEGGPAALATLLREALSPNDAFSAAVVMSHHFLTDLGYLRALAASDIPYVGLLGPVVRCERLLDELGADGHRIQARLHAPIGLDLGASSPEGIALSIVAEIQATLEGASMAPLSVKRARSAPAGPRSTPAGPRSTPAGPRSTPTGPRSASAGRSPAARKVTGE